MNLPSLARPRVLANIALHRSSLSLLRLRLALQKGFNLTHEYQPDPFTQRPAAKGGKGRACEDRYAAFSAHLPDDMALSVLDIGCNRGYFTFRMAERGGFCIGVDSDRSEIMFANAQAAVHHVPNAMFASMMVDERSVEGLPAVDVTLCLSIFHHWVRRYGAAAAKAIMRTIAGRTARYLIFETGTCEEAEAAWADELAFMGTDSSVWIRRFLNELGFDAVYEKGPFSTTVSTVPRILYVAERTDLRLP